MADRIAELCENFTKLGLVRECEKRGIVSTGDKTALATRILSFDTENAVNDGSNDEEQNGSQHEESFGAENDEEKCNEEEETDDDEHGDDGSKHSQNDGKPVWAQNSKSQHHRSNDRTRSVMWRTVSRPSELKTARTLKIG